MRTVLYHTLWKIDQDKTYIQKDDVNIVRPVEINIVVATISLLLLYKLAKKYAFKPGAIAAIIIAFLSVSISMPQEYIPTKYIIAG